MLSRQSSIIVHTAILITAFFILCDDCVAFSFPFRTFDVGDTVPAADFTDYKNKQNLSFSALKGKNVLAVFWGADISEKKEHSVKVLKQLNALTPFFKDQEVTVFSVNIQGDSSDIIDEVLKESGNSSQVFIDQTQQAYSILGIYVMPAMLLINQSGKVVAGFGYSKNSVAHIKGEIEIMLGKKTRAQVEEEINPTLVELSAEKKQATHHMNFAAVMLKRGMTETAIREYEQALTLEPGLAQAAIELGCLYLETGNLPKAEETLQKAHTLSSDSLRGQICESQLKARLGKIPEAQSALEKLKKEHPDTPKIDYLLGRLWDDQKQLDKAAKYYRQAFEILKKNSEE